MDANQNLDVTLTAHQWNLVLNYLAEGGPYRTVAPLMQAIQEQCERQDPASPHNVINAFPTLEANNS